MWGKECVKGLKLHYKKFWILLLSKKVCFLIAACQSDKMKKILQIIWPLRASLLFTHIFNSSQYTVYIRTRNVSHVFSDVLNAILWNCQSI